MFGLRRSIEMDDRHLQPSARCPFKPDFVPHRVRGMILIYLHPAPDRWSWRWWFDGQPPAIPLWASIGRSVVLFLYAAPALVLMLSSRQHLLRPFGFLTVGMSLYFIARAPAWPVRQLERETRGKTALAPVPSDHSPEWPSGSEAWLIWLGLRTLRGPSPRPPIRPASWYRFLALVWVGLAVAELLLAVDAIATIPDSSGRWLAVVWLLPSAGFAVDGANRSRRVSSWVNRHG